MSQQRDENQERSKPEGVRESPGQFARALDEASKYFMGKADVQDFGAGLNDYVRVKFEELWQLAQRPKGDQRHDP